ncbi:MAG: hypothetical protein Ct9H300mP1_16990 [Planctomycetaceae bacterium]|nr:MAG: hypothetical protein Ct9H300mP1_16990 [Planctomycetaceae bacterium]
MKLEPLFAEFDGLEPRERLEFSDRVLRHPPGALGSPLDVPPPRDCRVLECPTAVDLWVDVDDGL